MGALTFDALLRSLKPEGRAPDPVYYLHGDEDILKDEALRALTARAMEAAARDFNVDTRSAADLDAATLRALVDTPPLLAQTRVVVLRGIEQMRRSSISWRRSPPDGPRPVRMSRPSPACAVVRRCTTWWTRRSSGGRRTPRASWNRCSSRRA